MAARCGDVVVPLDRARPTSRTIGLQVALYAPTSGKPAPDPVIVLAGGPGVDEVSDQAGTSFLALFGGTRSIILFNQRGVVGSGPSLDCPEVNDLPASRTRTDYLSALRTCHTRLVQAGLDLSAYTDLATADDVYAIQRALGYKAVNVLAFSYGTRRTLLFMRRHPAGIRSVVLVSVLPPQVNTITALAAEITRVITFLTRGCAAAPACHRRYPRLQTVVAHLVARLNTHPIVVTGFGRVTGDVLVGLLDRVMFATVQNVPALPSALSQLAAGNDAQLASLVGQARSSPISVGVAESAVCSFDAAATTPQAVVAAVRAVPPAWRSAAAAAVSVNIQGCRVWDVAAISSAWRQPVSGAIPTLILSGEDDVRTPPSFGAQVARTLRHASAFTVPGTGHVLGGRQTCAPQIERGFVSHPHQKPDGRCLGPLLGASIFDRVR